MDTPVTPPSRKRLGIIKPFIATTARPVPRTICNRFRKVRICFRSTALVLYFCVMLKHLIGYYQVMFTCLLVSEIDKYQVLMAATGHQEIRFRFLRVGGSFFLLLRASLFYFSVSASALPIFLPYGELAPAMQQYRPGPT